MSANNYILIKWNGRWGYNISERDADDGDFICQINPLVKQSKNLEEAVKRANEYQKINGSVEYGLHIIPRKKK